MRSTQIVSDKISLD